MQETQLEVAADRYLSLCLAQAMDSGALSAGDFMEVLPPAELMEALGAAPDLRAKLLSGAAGVHERIAPKKSSAAAAEDLQIALEEGLCNADDIVGILGMDNFVRYAEASSLWNLLTKDNFWELNTDEGQSRLLFMITTALEVDLVDLSQVFQAADPEKLVAEMPRDQLEQVLSQSLALGAEGAPLSVAQFVELVPVESWLELLSLDHLWQRVIQGEIAPAAGLGETDAASAQASSARRGAPAPEKKRRARGKKRAPGRPANSAQTALSDSAEKKARATAMDRLAKRKRLPKTSAKMRTPVLLGLDSMYLELLNFETDEDRAECIRDAFPNEEMLKEALLALAETLDPRLSESELRGRGVDAAGLVQLVLFEERRLANRAQGGTSSLPPPVKVVPGVPPQPPARTAPQPPPPAVSAPPPLPPQTSRRPSNPPPPLPNRR